MRRPFSSFLVLVAVGSARTTGFTIGRHLAGAAGSGLTSTHPSCKLQGFPNIPHSSSRFQRSSLVRLRMLRHVTTAALSLTMCSPVPVLKPSQQPFIQFTASFLLRSSSLARFEQNLLTERWDPLIAWFASDELMERFTVAANVECRQCPCCMKYKPCKNLDRTNRFGSLDQCHCLRCCLFFWTKNEMVNSERCMRCPQDHHLQAQPCVPVIAHHLM